MKRMTFTKGSTVVVSRTFDEFDPEDGYLVLEPGASIVVEFVGREGEQLGWLFGYEPGKQDHGWFPDWAVAASPRSFEASKLTSQAPAPEVVPEPMSARELELTKGPERACGLEEPSEHKPARVPTSKPAPMANTAPAANGAARPPATKTPTATTRAANSTMPSSATTQPQQPGNMEAPAPPVRSAAAAWLDSAETESSRLAACSELPAQPPIPPGPAPAPGTALLPPAQEPSTGRTCQPTIPRVPAPVAQPAERTPAPPLPEGPAPAPILSEKRMSASPMPPGRAPMPAAAETTPASPLSLPEQAPVLHSPEGVAQPPLPPGPPPGLEVGEKAVPRPSPPLPEPRPQVASGPGVPPPPLPVADLVPPPPELPLPAPSAPEASEPAATSLEMEGEVQLPVPGFPGHPARANILAELRQGIQAGVTLPMAGLHGRLLELLTSRRVVVIDAATGSGKSTLVPLMLAEHCAALGRRCRIVVTQPRRIAAKGLARRVAQQSGTQVGDIAGFRVGHDRADRNAPIVYVTAGHMLEALVHAPQHLQSFSHVVLDEVHERFVEADFLMSLLRLTLSRPETLAMRVVVMSATLQQTLGDFFRPLLLPAPIGAKPGHLSLPSRTPFEVRDVMWEDIRKEWPDVFMGGGKEPLFIELRPSRAKLLPARRRSDQLTKLCKDLAPFCARLLCELRNCGSNIALVFLPGLDQMRDVEDALNDEARKKGKMPPRVFLMHSALEEDTYKAALDPAPAGEWRVALATNIAESSLTVPGVSAVIDFGLHRVNVYDDDARMSMLVTEWCSQASMRQRRGRTGRTNPGVYVRLFPSEILEEIPEFDDSGVERSPLTRTALVAAHLAQLLSSPPLPRAGLLVELPGGGTGSVSFWDGPRGGWHVQEGEESATYKEQDLVPLQIAANHMLRILPSPPREDRIQSALGELRDLGALAAGEMPSVLGAACLKLPVDVPLGRLVLLGWAIGCPADVVVLAAALSLAPSCDVLRTPFNTRSVLERQDMKTLRQAVELRRRTDNGTLSEPLTVYNLCMEWLHCGGGSLGRQPDRVPWKHMVHTRMWTQFTEKVIELTEALLRLLPAHSRDTNNLTIFLKRLRGYPVPAPVQVPGQLRCLAALLTWALAPLGFVAVGQTPALYGGGNGAYDIFGKVVKENRGTMANSLWWPKLSEAGAREVAVASGCRVRWTAALNGEAFVGVDPLDARAGRHDMDETLEYLCRICGPFNGKETLICTQGTRFVAVKPPRHPCAMNWYMPRRDGHGVLEVRVNWKSQAETVIHVPSPSDRSAVCRPKHLLVASGGDYLSSGGRRSVVLRGVTLLPMEDGGRSALLWLLAAGTPRVAKFVALAAPGQSRAPDDFEVRALRFWQRTLRLPTGNPLTSRDLRAVNTFRGALQELQRRKPHRLAGKWRDTATGAESHIECLDASPEGSDGQKEPVEDTLVVSGGTRRSILVRSSAHTHRWCPRPPEASAGQEDGAGLQDFAEEEPGGKLRWSDGSVWEQHGFANEPSSVLEAWSPETVGRVREVAEALLGITNEQASGGGRAAAGCRTRARWPARLVPVHTLCPDPSERGPPPTAPFDLATLEDQLAAFGARLAAEDLEEDSESEAEREAAGSDEEGGTTVDVSQEGVNEEYMWRLAEEMDWGPKESRHLCFVESAIALPPSAICVECEQENKVFSKSQLARHPDERRCQECVQRSMAALSRPTTDGSDSGAKTSMTPVVAADISKVPQPAVCSACSVQLTKSNCSASQRQKVPSRRRCNDCISAAA